jgi:hypothetical protein
MHGDHDPALKGAEAHLIKPVEAHNPLIVYYGSVGVE